MKESEVDGGNESETASLRICPDSKTLIRPPDAMAVEEGSNKFSGDVPADGREKEAEVANAEEGEPEGDDEDERFREGTDIIGGIIDEDDSDEDGADDECIDAAGILDKDVGNGHGTCMNVAWNPFPQRTPFVTKYMTGSRAKESILF